MELDGWEDLGGDWGEEIKQSMLYGKLFSVKRKKEREFFSIHTYDRGLVSKMDKEIKH